MGDDWVTYVTELADETSGGVAPDGVGDEVSGEREHVHRCSFHK